MGFRFRKSFKLAPGVKLNIGKKSMGISVGDKYGGISHNTKTGTRARVTAYGTGLSYSTTLGGKKKQMKKTNETTNLTQTSNGGCLMTCLKGCLYIMLLPLYWIYGVIWFIFLRKKLNNDLEAKKKTTTKCAIFTALSLLIFCAAIGDDSTTTPTEPATIVAGSETYTNLDISEETKTENISKDISTKQLPEEEPKTIVEEIVSEETTIEEVPAEDSSSENVNPDSEQENEIYTQLTEPETTPAVSSESKSVESAEFKKSVESSDNVVSVPIVVSQTSTNASSGGDSNFNTHNNPEQQNTSMSWVLNTSSKKIHYPSCKSVSKIAPHNYSTSSDSLDILKTQGYDTCGNCFK